MEFHYVIGYDTDSKKWFVEGDTEAAFPGGHVFDLELSQNPDRGYDGWFEPQPEDKEYLLDTRLLSTLEYIVDTFPLPKED